jgi:chromosome segregation ATPase
METARIREIMEKQAECVASVIEENKKLRDENDYLGRYIKSSDATRSNLLERKNEAEKKIAKLEETIQDLCDKNATLVGKIAILETDYKELSDIHESLITKIEKSGLDFTIDSIQ